MYVHTEKERERASSLLLFKRPNLLKPLRTPNFYHIIGTNTFSPSASTSLVFGSDSHGFCRCCQDRGRDYGKCHSAGLIFITRAHLHHHMQEEGRGAVLASALPGHPPQLHAVGRVRYPPGAPPQHAGAHHQRVGPRHRAHLRPALPPLLAGAEAPARLRHAAGGSRLRRGRGRARPHPGSHAPTPLPNRRLPVRRLRDGDVCGSSFRHEAGHQDTERGVHAPVLVLGLVLQWRLLDDICSHPLRSLHHYSKWSWCALCGCPADTVRSFLQILTKAAGREEEESRDVLDRGGHQWRHQQDQTCTREWSPPTAGDPRDVRPRSRTITSNTSCQLPEEQRRDPCCPSGQGSACV